MQISSGTFRMHELKWKCASDIFYHNKAKYSWHEFERSDLFFFGRDVAMWTDTLHEKSHKPFCFVLKATVFKHVNIPILRKEIAWKIDNLRVYNKEIENLTKRNSLSSRPCSKRS